MKSIEACMKDMTWKIMHLKYVMLSAGVVEKKYIVVVWFY